MVKRIPSNDKINIISLIKESADEQASFDFVSIDKLETDQQCRTIFAEGPLEELAQSIKEKGIIEPLIVQPSTDEGRYKIIAGERRWRAAKLIGLPKVPVFIRKESQDSYEIALIENIQREDLTPVEEAHAFSSLIQQHHYTHEILSKRVGKSRTYITNSLRLLSLSEPVQDAMNNKQLSAGHAKLLVTLSEELQLKALEKIITLNLSVRETEQLIKKLINEAIDPVKPIQTYSTKQIEHWEKQFLEKVDLPVSIKLSPKGKGRISFKINDIEEVEKLLNKL